MNVRTVATACALAIIPFLFFARSSSADIYKYVDRNGAVVLADDLRKVPQEYRGQVVVIREQQEGGKGKSSEKAAKVEKDDVRVKGKVEEGFQWEKIKGALKGVTKGKPLPPALAVIVCIYLYFIFYVAIGRICSFLEQRKLAFVLRIVLTLGLLIYLSRIL